MEAFFEKRVNIEGRHRILPIDKNIVEVVVREMLYNPNDENHQLAGDSCNGRVQASILH